VSLPELRENIRGDNPHIGIIYLHYFGNKIIALVRDDNRHTHGVVKVQDFEPLREILKLIQKARNPAVQDRRNISYTVSV